MSRKCHLQGTTLWKYGYANLHKIDKLLGRENQLVLAKSPGVWYQEDSHNILLRHRGKMSQFI